ncbi:lipase family protein [Leptolyngbya sp. PL-A3]|uniref:lipase family protein n=1 Tax=Leptolyngbya sp. PL-A3 TaxID=2933911 RepID=UPI0032968FCB
MYARIARIWQSPNRWILLLAATITVGTIGAAVTFLVKYHRAATAQIPSTFYTPPQPLPPGQTGSIIRKEALPSNLPEGAQAWRVMYRSTGLEGNPIAVTGTIVAPNGTSVKPRNIIAWAHGTTGIRPECGVSHTSDPYQQTPVIERMLAQGFVIAITNYPGLGTPGVHPYMVGQAAAHSVLDSVRASRQIVEVSAGNKFVVWGASQGGNSALWTAQLAEAYASELKLLGVAASAPAINLRKIAEFNLDKKAGGIFLGYVFAAWAAVYPGADLNAIIKPDERANFDRMIKPCFTSPAGFLPIIKTLRTPTQYLSVDILKTEPWNILFEKNSPNGRIEVPIVIAHGTADSLIPVELSEAEAARRCKTAEDVQFARYPGSTHDAREDTAVYILGWVVDRFAGRPTPSNCPN